MAERVGASRLAHLIPWGRGVRHCRDRLRDFLQRRGAYAAHPEGHPELGRCGTTPSSGLFQTIARPQTVRWGLPAVAVRRSPSVRGSPLEASVLSPPWTPMGATATGVGQWKWWSPRENLTERSVEATPVSTRGTMRQWSLLPATATRRAQSTQPQGVSKRPRVGKVERRGGGRGGWAPLLHVGAVGGLRAGAPEQPDHLVRVGLVDELLLEPQRVDREGWQRAVEPLPVELKLPVRAAAEHGRVLLLRREVLRSRA